MKLQYAILFVARLYQKQQISEYTNDIKAPMSLCIISLLKGKIFFKYIYICNSYWSRSDQYFK